LIFFATLPSHAIRNHHTQYAKVVQGSSESEQFVSKKTEFEEDASEEKANFETGRVT